MTTTWMKGILITLRDHFHPPLTPGRSWDELHGSWPAMIVQALRPHLPPGYVAAAQVHLGSAVEFDVEAYPRRDEGAGRSGSGPALAVAVAWPLPTLSVSAGPDDLDVYEVRVTRISGGRRLVAVVEIVSPSNKDRPDSRRDCLHGLVFAYALHMLGQEMDNDRGAKVDSRGGLQSERRCE